jgi:hypothetical protein
MGWTLHYNTTKDELVADLTKPFTAERTIDGVPVRVEAIKHTIRGNRLWIMRRRTDPDRGEVRYILLCLLQADRKNNGYGYKDMSEDMHPYYYDCPVTWLDDLTDPINDGSREWREQVRTYHAREKAHKQQVAALKPGDEVTIYGKAYVVEGSSFINRRLTVRQVENGLVYGALRSQITIKESSS